MKHKTLKAYLALILAALQIMLTVGLSMTPAIASAQASSISEVVINPSSLSAISDIQFLFVSKDMHTAVIEASEYPSFSPYIPISVPTSQLTGGVMHTLILPTNLFSPDTDYYFRIIAYDDSGGQYVSISDYRKKVDVSPLKITAVSVTQLPDTAAVSYTLSKQAESGKIQALKANDTSYIVASRSLDTSELTAAAHLNRPLTGMNLAPGDYKFRILAIDVSGNTVTSSTTDTRNISATLPNLPSDTTPPSITGVSVSAAPAPITLIYTLGETVSMGEIQAFRVSDNAKIASRNLSQTEKTIGLHTSVSLDLNLPDGEYKFKVSATDAAGNNALSDFTGSRIIDTIPPQIATDGLKIRNQDTGEVLIGAPTTKTNRVDLLIPVSAITDPSVGPTTQIEFSNNGSTFGSITELGAPINGYYTFPNWYIPNVNAPYTVYARIYDSAGNATTLQSTIKLDQGTNIIPETPGHYAGGASGQIYNNIHLFTVNDNVIITNLNVKAGQDVYLSAASYSANPNGTDTIPAGLTPIGKFFDLSLNPSSAVTFPVTVRVYLTQAELDAISAKATQIAGLGYYSATDNKWHLYNGAGESNNIITSDRAGYVVYVETNITHFTPLVVFTDITAPEAPSNIAISLDGTTATVSWNAVSGAAEYTVTVTDTVSGTSSTLEHISSTTMRITGLTAGKEYTVTVKATDAFGNKSTASVATRISVPSAQAAQPQAAAKAKVTEAAAPHKVKTTAGAAKKLAVSSGKTSTSPSTSTSPTPTPTPTESASPTPSESPTPGEVQGEEGETTSKDRTSWIVLGVLILLAAAATAGYFYWFREEDDDISGISGPSSTPTKGGGAPNGAVGTRKADETVKEGKPRDDTKKDEGPPPPEARW